MSTPKFEYRGDLSVTLPLAGDPRDDPPLPRAGRRERVARTARMRRRLRGRRARHACATSNEKELGLAAFLPRARGCSTPRRPREAERAARREGLRMGQVLLQMGSVTPERLNAAIAGPDPRDPRTGRSIGTPGEACSRSALAGRRTSSGWTFRFRMLVVEGIRRSVQRQAPGPASGLRCRHDPREDRRAAAALFFGAASERSTTTVDGKTPLQRLCARGDRPARRRTPACSTPSSASAFCAG